MKIIIVGGGKVGTALSHTLVQEDHNITLIEQDETVLKQITKHQDILGILGNGTDFRILEEADVQHCDLFIALTEKDEVNMIAALLAKKMGAKDTIVRVRNPEYSNPYFRDQNFLGFSQIINPELLTARHIANTIEFPNAQSVEHFANGRLILMEFKLSEQSKLADISIPDFRQLYPKIVICAIERQKETIIPDGQTIIQSGDRIFVTGRRGDMVAFHNHIKSQTVKSFMMVGGGKIAYYLLNILKSTRIRVKLLEIDGERANFFSQEFPNLHVVKGDGTSRSLLLEEGAEHYDAIATLTGVDEENILTSMYLETLEIPKTFTKVNRTSLLEIISDQSFSTMVTPKLIAVDSMIHFIRGRSNAADSNLTALHHIANGKVETLQFQISKESVITQKPLEQLSLKPNVLIMAIIRKNQPIFPTGHDQIQIGDQVIVATLQQNIQVISDLLV